jgi:hypothetical protein
VIFTIYKIFFFRKFLSTCQPRWFYLCTSLRVCDSDLVGFERIFWILDLADDVAHFPNKYDKGFKRLLSRAVRVNTTPSALRSALKEEVKRIIQEDWKTDLKLQKTVDRYQQKAAKWKLNRSEEIESQLIDIRYFLFKAYPQYPRKVIDDMTTLQVKTQLTEAELTALQKKQSIYRLHWPRITFSYDHLSHFLPNLILEIKEKAQQENEVKADCGRLADTLYIMLCDGTFVPAENVEVKPYAKRLPIFCKNPRAKCFQLTPDLLKHFNGKCFTCGLPGHKNANTVCPMRNAANSWNICDRCRRGFHQAKNCRYNAQYLANNQPM